jgi:hypothetical protein
MLREQSTNLMNHRASGSVWDKRGWNGPTIEERLLPWLVGAAAAAAVTYGTRRRSWGGVACVMGGFTMWTCATSGRCNPRYASARLDELLRQRRKDRVTNESMHSFPASDPPSFTTTAATTSLHAPASGHRAHTLRPAAQLVIA